MSALAGIDIALWDLKGTTLAHAYKTPRKVLTTFQLGNSMSLSTSSSVVKSATS